MTRPKLTKDSVHSPPLKAGRGSQPAIRRQSTDTQGILSSPTTESRLANLETSFKGLDRIENRLKKLDLIDEIHDKLRNLDEIFESISFFNKNFEDLKNSFNTLQEENISLKQQNASLSNKVSQLEEKLDDLDNYNRRNNIEIVNVPLGKDEEPDRIIEKIAEVLDVKLNMYEIEACHRVTTRNGRTQHLVARFVNRRVKEKLIANARKKRITTKDLGFSGKPLPIFVKEHLSPKKKELFYLALLEKRKHNWKSLWTHNGHIYARKDQMCKSVVTVSTKDDLALFSERH